jgi:hypothetical protein
VLARLFAWQGREGRQLGVGDPGRGRTGLNRVRENPWSRWWVDPTESRCRFDDSCNAMDFNVNSGSDRQDRGVCPNFGLAGLLPLRQAAAGVPTSPLGGF